MNVRAGVVFLVLAVLPSAGCSASTRVSGRVTCNGTPVKGTILFSPFGEGAENTGTAVGGPLKDGNYDLALKTTGKHRVLISPSDVKYPAPPGEEYPCDLTPQVHEVKGGANTINIELPPRGR